MKYFIDKIWVTLSRITYEETVMHSFHSSEEGAVLAVEQIRKEKDHLDIEVWHESHEIRP